MSEPKIRRKYKSLPVALSTSTAVATTLRWDDVAGGALLMGTSSTATSQTIQLWGSDSTGGAFGRVYKADGSAADVTLSPSTTESRVYSLPDECYGLGALKLVAGTTHSTAAACIVMLKT